MPQTTSRRTLWRATAVAVASLCLAACAPHPQAQQGVINVVAAENQYGNVVAQLGGPYVHVTSVLTNPNADPHSFEASTSLAEAISQAQLVVQNGLGYDAFMATIEAGSPNKQRKVVVGQQVRHLPDTTTNPHLWYDPATMPAVAAAITADLISLAPSHRAYFTAHLAAFDRSLAPWQHAIAAFRAAAARYRIAVNEPVADDLLSAMGVSVATPWALQRDLMNGVEPAPQEIATQDGLLRGHLVRALCVNQQVSSALTSSLIQVAHTAGIPVVAVNETMPVTDTYQQWMLATTTALAQALTSSKGTA